MRVAILGRTQMLYRTIEVLLRDGHNIVLIGTCKAAKEYSKTEEDFREYATTLGIPFFCDANINKNTLVELIKSVKADIGISMNWLTVIGREVIELFPYGILNAHPGDLPQYRGNACPNWAIINGEKELCISIHYMLADQLDAGAIVLKKRYSIDNTMNITKFYKIMEEDIPQLFLEAIREIDMHTLKVIPQGSDLQLASRCYPRVLTDSFIDWNMNCDKIIKLINASCFPFAGAYTFYGEKKLYIMECEMKEFQMKCYVIPGQVIKIDKIANCVEVAASDGIIVLKNLYINGEKYEATQILKSTRIRLNYCIEEEIYLLKARINELESQIEKLKEKI